MWYDFILPCCKSSRVRKGKRDAVESKNYAKHYLYLKTVIAQVRDLCYPQACLFSVSTLSAVK